MKRGASVPIVHGGADDPSLRGRATTSRQPLLQRGVPQLVPGPPAAVLRGGAPLPGDVGAEAAHLAHQLAAPPGDGGRGGGGVAVHAHGLAARAASPSGAAGHVDTKETSQSPRSRRRRTIPKGQLQLALKGLVGHTYAYSFIATHLPQDAVEMEFKQRRRANYAWQTAAVIATNLTSMLSAVNLCPERQEAYAAAGGILTDEQLAALGHPHNTQLLRRLVPSVPARLVRGGRRLRLRLGPGMFHKEEFWAPHHHVLRLDLTG